MIMMVKYIIYTFSCQIKVKTFQDVTNQEATLQCILLLQYCNQFQVVHFYKASTALFLIRYFNLINYGKRLISNKVAKFL